MGNNAGSSLNTKGFTECLLNNEIPEKEHITYGGAFN
jgi:hypothetical protein